MGERTDAAERRIATGDLSAKFRLLGGVVAAGLLLLGFALLELFPPNQRIDAKS